MAEARKLPATATTSQKRRAACLSKRKRICSTLGSLHSSPYCASASLHLRHFYQRALIHSPLLPPITHTTDKQHSARFAACESGAVREGRVVVARNRTVPSNVREQNKRTEKEYSLSHWCLQKQQNDPWCQRGGITCGDGFLVLIILATSDGRLKGIFVTICRSADELREGTQQRPQGERTDTSKEWYDDDDPPVVELPFQQY